MKKKTLLLLLIVLAIVVAILLLNSNRKENTKTSLNSNHIPVVAITQIATHPALDEVRQGIINGLDKRGYKEPGSVKIIFKNANGDPSLTLPIAQEFARMDVDVIVPISTPSALSTAKTTTTIPIVFSGVTDPIGVGLISNYEKPAKNITGVSDQWPYKAQMAAFFKYFPNTKKIGMLYTRGDDVSKIGVDAVTELSKEMGFKLELVPISSPQDIYPSAVSLLRRVDAVFTGIDHLILGNMDGLVKASEETHKPLFGGDTGSVEQGAVLALSIDMAQFGDITSDLVAEVLKGIPPGEIPVRRVTSGKLIINQKSANEFGLSINKLRSDGAQIINQEK